MKTNITAEQEAMRDRDALNRVKRLLEGGLLTEQDKRRLRRAILKGGAPTSSTRAPKEKRHEVTSADPKTFEGTYAQRLRRRKVYRLRMMNKTIAEITKETGAGNKTVIHDLRAIDEALHRTIDKGQADAILNERLSNLEALRDLALVGLEESEGNEKIGYLNTLTKLEEQITKLLQDAGVLRKATQRHELTGSDGMPLPAASAIPESIHVTFGAPSEKHQEKIVYLQPKEIEEPKQLVPE